MADRVYHNNNAAKGITDNADDFLKKIVDWDNNVLKTSAQFTGTLVVNLDSANDSVEVFGRDSLDALKPIRTDSGGRVVTVAGNQVASHITPETITDDPGGVALVLDGDVVSVIITNTGVTILEISFNDFTNSFPIPVGGVFNYDGNNSNVKLRSQGALGSIKGIQVARE